MTINASAAESIILNEEPLEKVDDFTYLILSKDKGTGKGKSKAQ